MTNKTLLQKNEVLPINDTDLTGKWIVINPIWVQETFLKQLHVRKYQIMKAEGGFGCKPNSLSMLGGKVFCKDVDGVSETVYRNDIIGYASLHHLREIGVDIEELLKD